MLRNKTEDLIIMTAEALVYPSDSYLGTYKDGASQ